MKKMLICSYNFNAWGRTVGRVDNAIQLINPYPADKYNKTHCIINTEPSSG